MKRLERVLSEYESLRDFKFTFTGNGENSSPDLVKVQLFNLITACDIEEIDINNL